MSDDEWESPRAAIHKWLESAGTRPSKRRTKNTERRQQSQQSQTGKRGSPDRQGSCMNHALTRTPLDPGDEDLTHRHERHQGSTLEQRRSKAFNSAPHKSQDLGRHAREPQERDVAQRLGLHAPFRNFRDGSEVDEYDLNELSRSRKRRRRESSTNSYLEPVTFDDPMSIDGNNRHPPMSVLDNKKLMSCPKIFSERSTRSPSSRASSTSRRLAISYEKRPRRKTREDRYELKAVNKNQKKGKEKPSEKGHKSKNHKKSRRKEKSGTALMHDFTAHNVNNDRLTVKLSCVA